MTINNLDAFVKGLWDWGWLDQCFRGKNRMSDIDGVIERRREILVMEGKPPGKEVSLGQTLLFKALAQRGLSVLVLWGEPNDPREMMLWLPYQNNPSPKIATSKTTVQELVQSWFECADVGKPWPGYVPIEPVKA